MEGGAGAVRIGLLSLKLYAGIGLILCVLEYESSI